MVGPGHGRWRDDKMTSEQREEAVALYNADKAENSAIKLAAKYGVTRAWIYKPVGKANAKQ